MTVHRNLALSVAYLNNGLSIACFFCINTKTHLDSKANIFSPNVIVKHKLLSFPFSIPSILCNSSNFQERMIVKDFWQGSESFTILLLLDFVLSHTAKHRSLSFPAFLAREKPPKLELVESIGVVSSLYTETAAIHFSSFGSAVCAATISAGNLGTEGIFTTTFGALCCHNAEKCALSPALLVQAKASLVRILLRRNCEML